MAVHVAPNIINKMIAAYTRLGDFRAGCRNLQNPTLQSDMLDIMNPRNWNFQYLSKLGRGQIHTIKRRDYIDVD